MGEQATKPAGLSRRSFITGAATVAAVTALSGSMLYGCASEEDGGGAAGGSTTADGIYSGVCRANCFGGCLLNLHVRDGKLVRTSAGDFPNTDYNRICPRGLTHPARMYSAERLQYPMRRVGERGEGEFERISWDEAFEEIITKWQSYIDEFGPASITMLQGSGNFGACSGSSFGGITPRFRAITGFSIINTDVDVAQGYAGSRIVGGYSPAMANNEPTDYINSKTMIIWAANPAISQQHVLHFMLKAKENGTRLIVIDPVFNATAAKADWYIPVNPATDGVLAMSILNVLIANNMTNTEFLKGNTEAPLLIKEDGSFLRMSDLGVEPVEGDINPATGEPVIIDPEVVWDEATNGPVALAEAQSPALTGISAVNEIPVKTVWDDVINRVAQWTPEAAAEVCGVPADTISELARVYAQDGPVNTYSQLGVDHYINGHYNYWSMYAVSVATGNTGRPGAALGPLCVLPLHVINFLPQAMPSDSEGNFAQGGGPVHSINSILNIVDTQTHAGEETILKSIYISFGNTATVAAEHNKTVEWLKKIEFVVVTDTSMTETALYADILLPAAHWFEQTDVFTNCHTHPYFVWQEKVFEPLFECKTDFNILKEFATRLGYPEFFDFDEETFIGMLLENELAQTLGLTVDRLKEEKAVRFMTGESYISFEGGVFLTSTGRASFYKEAPLPNYNAGQEIDMSKEVGLYWEPTLEADKSSPARAQYPFHCISEHMRTRTHSQWWDVKCLEEYEAEPLVKINPEDAAELGIAEGDTVKMFNDRGSVVLKATLTSGYPRGIVGSPRSYHAREFEEGHFASLSTNQYNQVCANQAFNDVAVAIEKA